MARLATASSIGKTIFIAVESVANEHSEGLTPGCAAVIMDAMPRPRPTDGAQTLLVDADDTLWENNIYFERAIANFISFLNHHEYSPDQVREVLNDVERECILRHGYGLHSFAHALVQTFERLAVEPITPALHETIEGLCRTIAEQPIEIRPGVRETLT